MSEIWKRTRAAFNLPEGVTYLDGNSLGPLPKAALARVEETMRAEWGEMLIGGWNKGGPQGNGWMGEPTRLGDRIGALIGAGPGTTVIGDTLSIKVYQALAAGLPLAGERRIILSDNGNFPTDLYMAQGLIDTLGQGHELLCVEPEDVAGRIRNDIAVLLLTHVDYRTGRMHDMADLTRRAHEAGVIVVWDLAHSAGAVEVDLAACQADFAVGCTYKYLNAGPGAPAFITMRADHAATVQPALAGWLGHDAPFAFEPNYRAGPGIERFRVGTPSVLQMAALDAALDIWDAVDMGSVRARSIELSQAFIERVDTSTDLTLASPRDPLQRGSQVSFQHPEGYAVMQALIARGIIGDFRAPDILRFGFAPLYNTMADVARATDALADILTTGAWDRPEFRARKAVT
ncbi:kynureninase [Rhizobiaceae bacterium]|nr:kynureninase [Rhizobiaceae bacterium]